MHLPFLSPDIPPFPFPWYTSPSFPLIYLPFPNTPPLPFPWYISLSSPLIHLPFLSSDIPPFPFPWHTSPFLSLIHLPSRLFPGYKALPYPGILPPFTLDTSSSIFLHIHAPFLTPEIPSLAYCVYKFLREKTQEPWDEKKRFWLWLFVSVFFHIVGKQSYLFFSFLVLDLIVVYFHFC